MMRYDTHDLIQKSWTDDTMACIRNLPTSSLIILHAGGSNGWVDGALFLSCKKMSVASADYHYDMDSKIFEEWFEQRLIPNLPKNSVIVMDNAPYHSRQACKIPCTSTKKIRNLGFYDEKTYKNHKSVSDQAKAARNN